MGNLHRMGDLKTMSSLSTRLATPADANSAVEVLRRSIRELCEADHQHDEPTLERWLRNKTPEHFRAWCENPDQRVLIAELGAAAVGVAALHRSGEIRLCYVHPNFVRAGVGRALLCALEAQAQAWGLSELKLDSSLTARHFYERCGFTSAGQPTPKFGRVSGYPYLKRLAPSSAVGSAAHGLDR